MIEYDAGVIEEFAAGLYRQADTVVRGWILRLGGLGGIGGIVLNTTNAAGPPAAIFVAISGAFIGWRIGVARSLALRLQAQLALCQIAIEKNTRKT